MEILKSNFKLSADHQHDQRYWTPVTGYAEDPEVSIHELKFEVSGILLQMIDSSLVH